MNILAIGAHPDDIEIFMGGTLLAYQAMGAELSYCIATDGALGGVAGDAAAQRELAGRRRKEAESAAVMSGASVRFLDLPDGSLVADTDSIARLTGVICECAPSLVITHAANDYHADHRALAVAVRQAVGFRTPLLSCDTLMGVGFSPSIYVDTTRWFDRKAALIRCHESQDPDRFVAMACLQNRFRAAQCGAGLEDYAEAFRFDAVYPFADIRALLPAPPPVRPVRLRASTRTT